ncbi:hypothetical protein BLNAU_18032 [Blattamonas nauphoetae]|uniref:AraC effector-binding domain-containing protein n=1 Tax=Blattamonas nauphoetae TaxID=2049346 RepID=A0ABQ9X5J6_9EUKA|nr:hypothetical protein BLNAU_18032 [Blattamonas nauphoetae]
MGRSNLKHPFRKMPKFIPPKAKDKAAKLAKEPSIDEKVAAVQAQTEDKKEDKADFTVQIKPYGRIRGIGMKVIATTADISPKAAKLWSSDFGPRMGELKGQYPGSFGISVMQSEKPEDPFEYWAVIPVSDEEPIPDGMEEVIVEPRDYAQVDITFDKLPAAYQYLYGEWAQKNKEQNLSMVLPSVEFYPPQYMETKEMSICVPLEKKKE